MQVSQLLRGDDFRYRFEAGLPPESLGHCVVSNEKRDPRGPSSLGYTGDYTTQLYGDYN